MPDSGWDEEKEECEGIEGERGGEKEKSLGEKVNNTLCPVSLHLNA